MSQDLDVNGSTKEKENGKLSIPTPNNVSKSVSDVVSVLEAKANGM